MVLSSILKAKQKGQKQLAILIDPDRTFGDVLVKVVKKCVEHNVDFIYVGGSLLAEHTTQECIAQIKKINSLIPVVLFPGSSLQVTPLADAVLYLSLISGRNADYLIGKHVETALQIKKSGIETIPTGYILLDGGKPTSVSYLSNTQPIPADKPEIAVSTAVAGELLGMKLIYLENGSGALEHAGTDIIKSLKHNLSIPLIVGGGIRTSKQMQMIFEAGADLIVIGTAVEKDLDILKEMALTAEKING